MFVREKRRKPASKSKRGQAAAKQPSLWQRLLPDQVEQRHLDLLGLGLVAVSLYLGLVLYLGWDGGVAGNGAREALTYLLGKVAYLTPFLGALAGCLLIFRPLMPATAPLRTGAFLILTGVLLGLAAQTAGLGGGEARSTDFDATWMQDHGGLIGESLYWVAATLFQRAGAHIITVFLVLGGSLLLTGATLATLLTATGRVAGRAKDNSSEMARTIATRSRGREDADQDETAIATDVMASYPEADEFEPTVIVNADTESEHDTDSDQAETAEYAFEADLHDLEAAEPEPEDEAEPAADEQPEPTEPEVDKRPAPATGEQLSLTPRGKQRGGVTISDEIRYRLPANKALDRGRGETGPDSADYEAVARKLVETLGHFGVEARVVGIVSGPHVSRYELRLAPGIKVKKVSELANDLAYALASTDIRILAPIPGKQAVGVEVPNSRRKMVRLGDIYKDRPAKTSPLVAWLGKGIDGKPVWTDLAKMPHVLVAGTTGSGKSGCINAILSSILMHADPNEVRLVLVDPKQVELNHYEHVPHLLTPVVTSPRLASNVLANLIVEMESRYGIMSQARCRNLAELNRARKKAGEPPLPHILCVIDELADLMMVSPAEVEDSIIRLAQKSRATGIHLVLATQRPSTDIITGTIKVNIPARIAFAVSSQTDSRVILDQGGAEALLGQGDMLFRGAGSSKMDRIQGAFVTEDEIARITDHWAEQGEPEFVEDLLEAKSDAGGGDGDSDFDPDQDDLLERAIRLVIDTETASVSMIQRRLRVGYTRAGRLIDMLERRGVISGYEGSKPRQVLVSEADLPRILGWGSKSDKESEQDGAPEPDSGAARPDKLEV